MIQITHLFKRYVLTTCLILQLLLFFPMQSFAQQKIDLLAEDIAILRAQVEMITEAILTSTSITAEKKAELQELVNQISVIIDDLELVVEDNPEAESQRRENIESIKTVGNIKTYEVEVEIVMGPEEVAGISYDRSTTTYNYNFLTTLTQQQKVERMRELGQLTFAQLSAETGLSAFKTKASSTTTFKRFDNEWDAMNNYVQPAVSKGLEQYFGFYSIIDDVVVTIGQDIFSMAVSTDQDETVTFTVAQKWRDCFFGEVPAPPYKQRQTNNAEFEQLQCRDVGKLTYGVTYATYGNIRTSVAVSDADEETIIEQLANGLKGVGELFGEDDVVVTDELLDVIMYHPTYYVSDNKNITGFEPLATCIQPRMQIILGKIANHFVSNFQVSEEPGIYRVKNVVKQPTTGAMGVATQSDGCRDVNNSFFPSITLATSTPPAFVNVRPAGGTTNISENAILTEIKPIGNERDESMFGG